MSGRKIEAVMDGMVLLAESLHQLQVNFAINGIQNRLIPFCRFTKDINQTVRDRSLTMAEEVDGGRKGGNNEYRFNDDGPC